MNSSTTSLSKPGKYTLDALPSEILIQILEDPGIATSYSTIRSTCSHLNNLVSFHARYLTIQAIGELSRFPSLPTSAIADMKLSASSDLLNLLTLTHRYHVCSTLAKILHSTPEGLYYAPSAHSQPSTCADLSKSLFLLWSFSDTLKPSSAPTQSPTASSPSSSSPTCSYCSTPQPTYIHQSISTPTSTFIYTTPSAPSPLPNASKQFLRRQLSLSLLESSLSALLALSALVLRRQREGIFSLNPDGDNAVDDWGDGDPEGAARFAYASHVAAAQADASNGGAYAEVRKLGVAEEILSRGIGWCESIVTGRGVGNGIGIYLGLMGMGMGFGLGERKEMKYLRAWWAERDRKTAHKQRIEKEEKERKKRGEEEQEAQKQGEEA
ncbi:MAG: hypothetical protein Q9227_002855 [Pyrenula ochraceoflavens]